MTEITKLAEITVTTSEAARLLNLGDERIRQLAKGGNIPRAGRNKYPLIGVIHGYLEYLRDEERRSSKSAAASRMQDVKTERAEVELAVAKQELLPRDDLLAAVDFVSAAVKNEMLGLPARITRDPDERTQLDEEVGNALNRISQKIERAVGVATEGGDVFEGSGS